MFLLLTLHFVGHVLRFQLASSLFETLLSWQCGLYGGGCASGTPGSLGESSISSMWSDSVGVRLPMTRRMEFDKSPSKPRARPSTGNSSRNTTRISTYFVQIANFNGYGDPCRQQVPPRAEAWLRFLRRNFHGWAETLLLVTYLSQAATVGPTRTSLSSWRTCAAGTLSCCMSLSSTRS